MDMKKVCFRCGIEKDINEFHKNKRNTDGHKGTCKLCCRLYVDEHIDKKREYEKEHYKERRLKRKDYFRKYRKTNQYKEYRKSDKIKEYMRRYTQSTEFKEKRKEDYKNNKEKYRKYWKNDSENRRKRENNRYRNDLDYNITRRLRSRFFKATHRVRKEKSVLSIIGCTIDEFKSYLEPLFSENMSWELFQKGEIHADHIIPCEAFDMENVIHQQACFYYKNFQPLWESENHMKRDKYSVDDFNKYMDWYMINVYKK